MPTLAQRPITKAEAQIRTREHKREFGALKVGWVRLGKEVAESLDLGVPEKLGMNAREWIESTFQGSYSHIMRQIHQVRALSKVPQEKLERIPEGNANALSSLPEPLRNDSDLVDRAATESPSEFKSTVATVKLERLGIKPEQWATYARRVPRPVYDAMVGAEGKIARILQLDIAEDSDKRPASLITVMEALAQLVNGTPDERLITEIEGGENEPSM